MDSQDDFNSDTIEDNEASEEEEIPRNKPAIYCNLLKLQMSTKLNINLYMLFFHLNWYILERFKGFLLVFGRFFLCLVTVLAKSVIKYFLYN